MYYFLGTLDTNILIRKNVNMRFLRNCKNAKRRKKDFTPKWVQRKIHWNAICVKLHNLNFLFVTKKACLDLFHIPYYYYYVAFPMNSTTHDQGLRVYLRSVRSRSSLSVVTVHVACMMGMLASVRPQEEAPKKYPPNVKSTKRQVSTCFNTFSWAILKTTIKF